MSSTSSHFADPEKRPQPVPIVNQINTFHKETAIPFVISIFRRVRKIAKSDCYLRRVCLSVRIEQLGSHWTDFHEILYLKIFRKSVEKIKVLLKSDKNDGYFM
jgi:hypothetical protein